MSADIESLIIQWGNSTDLIDAPFSSEVPRNRPARFFTVERTGGPGERFRDLPTVAVQAWAESRAEASQLMTTFIDAMWSELHLHDGVSRVELNTTSHFPSADGEPRYQAVVQLVTA